MSVWWLRGMLVMSVLTSISAASSSAEQDNGKKRSNGVSNLKQSEVDEMVHNVLQWLQTFYKQNNRKARQYGSGKPEKPRPFERQTYLPPDFVTGYPLPGPKPSPGYEESPSESQSNTGSYQSSAATQYQPSSPGYEPSSQGNQPSTPGYQPSPSSQPITNEYKPSSGQPSTTGYQYPSNQPTYADQQQSNLPATIDNRPTNNGNDKPAYQPSTNKYQPSDAQTPSSEYQPPLTSPNQNYQPTGSETATAPSDSNTAEDQQNADVNPSPSAPETPQSTAETQQDEDRHPPHIHEITVDCGKEMMTINIEFNKVYNGLIYSKGFYKSTNCVYVQPNSNQIKYSFTVSLNECGTEFKTAFDTEGKAYLENTLVLQNEEGIQEVWDHIHRVRCLWEGNLSKQLSSSLSVGMLRQETTNVNGDTATAKLDIQVGRGPFAEPLNGLVKIGETLTLVISVTGDAGFDIQVKQCVAKDGSGNNVVPLTDENGCILKPKLFGAFQKTRETGNTGASILAYAFFNAFKFPDEMDMLIQCDVDLCKANCEACTLEQSLEPAKRKKRSLTEIANNTVGQPVTILKGFRVIFPEDPEELKPGSFCVSYFSFLFGAGFVLSLSVVSSITAAILWLKVQNRNLKK